MLKGIIVSALANELSSFLFEVNQIYGEARFYLGR